MANEKRLIDANALDEKLETLKVRFKALGRDAVVDDYNFVQTVLLTEPTIDAVEVVRCKDCKYGDCMTALRPDDVCCEMHDFTLWKADGFCCYGERREGE